MNPDDILAALDPEQREVAANLTGPMVVLAGAGTGKTRAITHRIAYGVASGVYKPQQVLAVTFTARAAAEMRARLRALGAHGVQARTFHSAALRQLQYFWPQAIGGTPHRLVDNKAALIAESARRLRLTTDRAAIRDLAGEIEWAKVSMLTPEAYERAPGRVPPTGFDQRAVARLYRAYEGLKEERLVIDFEDVLLLTVGILEDDARVAAAVREQYRYFVVDEYQDVSPLQQRLLDLWLGGRKELCVVGDASQTIYSFTGASSRHLLEFTSAYEGARVVKLVRDYRSTPQVVKAANDLLAARQGGSSQGGADEARWAEPLELRAQRPSGPEVLFAELADDAAEAEAVAAHIKKTIAAGTPASEIAVLFRTNGQSQAFEEALGSAGVPFKLRGAERFYERREVREGILQLRAAARAADPGEDPGQLARTVLSSLGYAETAPSGTGAQRERWESLAALVAVADEVAGLRRDRGEAVTLQDVVDELTDRAASAHVPTLDGVALASIHTAKGLEWDAVYLAGMSEGLMPISYAQTQAEIDEERRLLYVGITRARQQLHISWALSRTKGGSANRKPSRFLHALSPDVRARHGAVSSRERTGPARPRESKAAVCVVCGSPLTSPQERKLRHCSDCPLSFDESVFEALRAWRKDEADATGKPAFVVFTDATLMLMAEVLPSTVQELAGISGVGASKIERYGEAVLALVKEHRS
ncbi:ATP-dependent DNA helicase UvrD2 [Falsarthrobacter nasiphocae]|uniref:DNA 3'-5' helicase n=1 Tax=Falsarthrobacter nasiphocae TaxID=189863 RepID=A0AAE3YFT4_9MICC|nr:ATP-dependent DNA helicase UvrD2 [Falsarthrobacter nasiphocae]MDR6891447.1 DNA helicase-2/ATP-dependent DNA helicase PcrA [Falsarthrobacter nasiphocae]